MNMNEAKFNSIFNGLSNNVKKVYASVPLTEKWDINQIHTDLLKRGCAGHLKDTIRPANVPVHTLRARAGGPEMHRLQRKTNQTGGKKQ